MDSQPVPYKKQIFVCTYNRNGDGASCGDHCAEEIFTELRRVAKERGLHPEIRVAQAKCLGQCQQGVTVMVYPDSVWYKHVRKDDVSQLAEKYLIPKQ